MDYRDYIEINPLVRFGKPCIKGTRISVYDVLSWLASGMSNEDIISDYPQSDQGSNTCLSRISAYRERRATVAL